MTILSADQSKAFEMGKVAFGRDGECLAGLDAAFVDLVGHSKDKGMLQLIAYNNGFDAAMKEIRHAE